VPDWEPSSGSSFFLNVAAIVATVGSDGAAAAAGAGVAVVVGNGATAAAAGTGSAGMVGGPVGTGFVVAAEFMAETAAAVQEGRGDRVEEAAALVVVVALLLGVEAVGM
jgi:hypothetical protein